MTIRGLSDRERCTSLILRAERDGLIAYRIKGIAYV